MRLAFVAKRTRISVEDVSFVNAPKKSSTESAIRLSNPFFSGKPLAPMEVVMTGQPMAKAYNNLTRWPVPENNGATTIVLGR